MQAARRLIRLATTHRVTRFRGGSLQITAHQVEVLRGAMQSCSRHAVDPNIPKLEGSRRERERERENEREWRERERAGLRHASLDDARTSSSPSRSMPSAFTDSSHFVSLLISSPLLERAFLHSATQLALIMSFSATSSGLHKGPAQPVELVTDLHVGLSTAYFCGPCELGDDGIERQNH